MYDKLTVRDPGSYYWLISAFVGNISFPFIDSCHRYRGMAGVLGNVGAFVIDCIRTLCMCVVVCACNGSYICIL